MTDGERSAPVHVAFDSSVLLGSNYPRILAAIDLRYVIGYWSPWIVAEFTRVRTEWVAERGAKAGWDRIEMRRQLRQSRDAVNILIREFSQLLVSVDDRRGAGGELPWLPDPDDWPIMRTALAAGVSALVTDNSHDFPLGETRQGVLFLSSEAFLARLYDRFADSRDAIRGYVELKDQLR